MCMADMRELTGDFIELWKTGGWDAFFHNHENDLFLGIRHHEVNLYYQCYSLCKITLMDNKNQKYLKATTNKKYIDGSLKTAYRKTNLKELEERYACITKAIDAENQKAAERKAQQKLILNNNKNNDSNWYCVDMEYIKSIKGEKDGEILGRCDIIAVNKNTPGQTALIELKYGVGAIGGSSGVYKHTQDFYKLWMNKNSMDFVRKNISKTIRSLQELKISPLSKNYAEKFESNYKPEFYFIALDSGIGGTKDVQVQMQKYFLNLKSPTPSKKYNVEINGIILKEEEEPLRFNVINDAPNGFRLNFLFSNDNGDHIDNIIDSELYDKRSLQKEKTN